MAAVKDRIVRKVSFLPKPCNLHFRSHGGHRATMRGPPANTFLFRCSTFGPFGEKGSNSTPASRCLPPLTRLCSIGEQSGERGLLRVANGATFIEITRAHVVAHPSPLHPREERERERESFFLSYIRSYIIRFSWIPAGRTIRCDSSANEPSSQRLFSPLQRTFAHVLAFILPTRVSTSFFLSTLFSFSLHIS